jgi:uncharacterized protein YaiI (UPF0178 family)
MTVLVDADACPVKDDCIRVALRHATPVRFFANSYLRLTDHPLVSLTVTGTGFDAADDALAAAAGPGDVAVTADILLADRCLKAGAAALSPSGRPFTPDSIGGAVATRAIMADLRGGIGQAHGPVAGGPPPFGKADRARFLQALDAALVRAARRR